MVRYVVEDAAVLPLQVYNRLRILTREFLLSQVSGTMRAPRKTGGRMKPEAEGARPKPAVCRRLFADDDPADEGLRDNMFNQITEQINRNLDDACVKYNFDFRNEVPLEGDWSWEQITPDDDAVQPEAQPDTTPSRESTGTSPEPSPTADAQSPPADAPQPPPVPQ